MITTKNGSRFYTAAEKYAILEELEKWEASTGSHNVLRFCKDRNYPVAGVYEWRKFKKAGVPLEDSIPNVLVPGDPRIDAGHAQAARNRALKQGAVNPARQHLKPHYDAEDAREMKRERDRANYYKRKAQEYRDRAEGKETHHRENAYPDDATRTYWARRLLRARPLGRIETGHVLNESVKQGVAKRGAVVSRWAREYSHTDAGKAFLVDLYSGKAPELVPPVKPEAIAHYPNKQAIDAVIQKLGTENIKQKLAAMGQPIEPTGNGSTNPDMTASVSFRLQTLSTEIETLKEEIHQNTANMAKIISTLAEIETYFK